MAPQACSRRAPGSGRGLPTPSWSLLHRRAVGGIERGDARGLQHGPGHTVHREDFTGLLRERGTQISHDVKGAHRQHLRGAVWRSLKYEAV